MDKLSNSSDEELVNLYKAGNVKAFDELYLRYSSKLKRLIYYYVSDPDTADDVFHEIFIRVYRHIDKFNTNKAFSSWIYQIAANCSKNYLKLKKKNEALIEKEKFRMKGSSANLLSPEEEIVGEIDIQEFNSAINDLKDKFRDVFLLRFDHKMKYMEIAEILNCSERTAKWRMKKAIEKITLYLKERGIV